MSLISDRNVIGNITRSMSGMRVSDVTDMLQENRIELRPSYQRAEVWTRPEKQKLIDSILRGYDIPKIYARRRPKGDAVEMEIIDGQQRLSAIRDFHQGTIKVAKNTTVEGVNIGGKNHGSLPPRIRKSFDNFELHCVVYEHDLDDDTCREIFQRQQFGKRLQGAEKINVIPGNMQDFIRKIAAHPVLSHSSIRDHRSRHNNAATMMIAFVWPDTIQKFDHQTFQAFVKKNADFDLDSELALKIESRIDRFAVSLGADGMASIEHQNELMTQWAAFIQQETEAGINAPKNVGQLFATFMTGLRADKPVHERFRTDFATFTSLSSGSVCNMRNAIFQRASIMLRVAREISNPQID
jgi:hypothetical protein